MKPAPLLAALALTFAVGCYQPEPFVHGDGSEAERIAFEHMERRAARGDLKSEVDLVFFREWLPGRYEEAIPKLEALTERGSADAAGLLYLSALKGHVAPPDTVAAARWLAVGARLGNERMTRDLRAYRDYRVRHAVKAVTPIGDRPR